MDRHFLVLNLCNERNFSFPRDGIWKTGADDGGRYQNKAGRCDFRKTGAVAETEHIQQRWRNFVIIFRRIIYLFDDFCCRFTKFEIFPAYPATKRTNLRAAIWSKVFWQIRRSSACSYSPTIVLQLLVSLFLRRKSVLHILRKPAAPRTRTKLISYKMFRSATSTQILKTPFWQYWSTFSPVLCIVWRRCHIVSFYIYYCNLKNRSHCLLTCILAGCSASLLLCSGPWCHSTPLLLSA